jgi:hypothetical protein
VEPIILKNNVEVYDIRLGRIEEFDERSKNFPLTSVLKTGVKRNRIWRCNEYYNQKSTSACFLPDTYVRKFDGEQVKIQDLKVLDKVLTAEGNEGVITSVMCRQYNGNIFNLKFKGHHGIKCTPEHPFLTQRGYVEAKNLLLGEDYVCITKSPFQSIFEIDTTNIMKNYTGKGKKNGTINHANRHGKKVISTITDVPVILNANYNLGRILGLYAAEGYIGECRVMWTFNMKEEHTLVKELCAILKEELNITARIQYRVSNNVIDVVVWGKHWGYLFGTLISGTSKRGDKKLSRYITNLNEDFAKGLLYGWLDGDGYRRDTSYIGVSVCHQLSLDMHNIATSLNITSSINESLPSINKHAKTRQNRWIVTLQEGNGQNHPKKDDDCIWRKYMSCSIESYEGYVFNLHVEGDNSYVAENIGVHNCVAYSISHELASTPVEVLGLTDDYIFNQIYCEAQKIDPWQGSECGNNPPKYGGTSVLAGVKTAQALGYFNSYKWAFGLNDLLLGLSSAGPAVLGIKWYSNMTNPDVNGFIKPTGNLQGGHAILARGVNWNDKYVILRNSWGQSWNKNGDCYITFDDLDKLLKDNGEAVFFIGRKNPNKLILK